MPRTPSVVSNRRREQYESPKLIFAKLCKALTASVDRTGDYAGLNVNFVIPDAEVLDGYGDRGNRTLDAQLRDAGRRRREVEEARIGKRIEFVEALIGSLGVANRRHEEPAWTMPRQAALLAATEVLSAEDLSEFWRILRRSARQLGVEITPSIEREVLNAVQQAREHLLTLGATANEVDAEIDRFVFELYSIGPDDEARIRGDALAAAD